MPAKKAKKVDTNTYELEILLDKESFDKETDKVFRKNASRMNIPGFRRGKAPRSIIEKMYGKDVFTNDAIDALLPEAYEAAVAEAKLEVVDRPEIELVSIDEAGVLLKAKVTVKPVVTVTEYKGLKASRPVVSVTDEEVNEEIDAARKRNARVLSVEDGAVEENDDAVIDYKGFIGDEPFEGGEAEGHTLKIGSHSFIPGFEEQLIGHKSNEEFDIFVTFPEDYQAEHLAGKEARFHIFLHEIKRSELPELDDEFVKDVSSFDTVAEYRKDISDKILERKQKSADRQVETELLDQVVANLQAEIPRCMIEHEIDSQVNDYDYRLKSQGLSLDMFFQYTGQTMEQLRSSFESDAERQVKLRLALEFIGKAEKIKASKKDIEDKYKEYATQYSVDVDFIKERISEEDLASDIVSMKVIEFIKENAVITDAVEPKPDGKKDGEKKPKKSSKAKAEKPEEEKPEEPAKKKKSKKQE